MSEIFRQNEIKIVRDYDAPVQTVWAAWTDPKIVDQWWGPRGFSNRTASMDVRSEGSWRYTMHGPDHVDYQNVISYIEVEPHRRLVYDHSSSETTAPLFRVTVVFNEVDGKTRMVMTMAFQSAEQVQAAKLVIKQASGESTWDRLGELLIKRTSERDVFVINRSFDVPLKMLAEMWTDASHLAQWLPPTGATMKYIRSELRPGGTSFYVMDVGAGRKWYGRSTFLTIEKPHKIIYLQQFCDENEAIIAHPMAPSWPKTVKTTVTLTSEGESRTRINLIWEPHGAQAPETIDTFIKARPGMTQGWTGSFKKLEEVASKVLSSSGANLSEKVS